MPESQDLLEIVRCPECRGQLESVEAPAFECASCGVRYPIHDGTPWLYRDVPGSRAQWAAKLQQFRSDLLAEHAELEAAASESGLLPATAERLARQKAGLERLGQQVFALLEVFAFAHSEAGGSLPRDRIPSQQHVSSYLETAFRDWCWGDAEVAEVFSVITPLLGELGSSALALASASAAVGESAESLGAGLSVLVLGGGAGRLSFELARHAAFERVIQLDLNPLLTRIGERVSRGEALELTEMPRFAAGLDDVAVDQTLRAPAKPNSLAASLHYLLGDAFAPPFENGRFDLLVTPWFVDILPEDFRRLARRLGRLLAEGGRWLSFGPLSFESVGVSSRFVPEEMVEALEAAGFEVGHSALAEMAYLQSPHGLPRRTERVFVYSATRRRLDPLDEPFEIYPEWMTDGAVAIPALPEFESMRAERTFDLEILKCIDGRASIEDIVVILCARYGLEPDRCRNTINRFFSRSAEGD